MVLKFTPVSETAPVTSERPERRQETPPPRRPPIKFTPVEERQLQAEAGNIEFNAALANTNSYDAVAQLGFTTEEGMATYGSGDTAHYTKNTTRNQERYEQSGDRRYKPGSVHVTSGPARPDIWNHEFRHKGIEIILNSFTPDQMVAILGQDQARALVAAVTSNNEGVTELFDDPNADAGPSRGTMRSTIQRVNDVSGNWDEHRNALTILAENLLERRRAEKRGNSN